MRWAGLLYLALIQSMSGALAGELIYTTTKDGVSVKWISNQTGSTTNYTWEITQGGSTKTVVGTMSFASPLAPTWSGTLNGSVSSGTVSFFVQADGTVG